MNLRKCAKFLFKFTFFNVLYRIDRFVLGVSKKFDLKGKKILDIGAENSPYQDYFSEGSYYTLDIKQNKEKNIDYIGDLNTGVPSIIDQDFDYILCTQVIEHVREIKKCFAEFNRILKPGGRLFLTTNFVYEEHMIPEDFFRFTSYGLRFLGESNGFKVEHLKPHGGIFQVLAYVIIRLPVATIIKRNSVCYYLYFLLFSVVIIPFNLLCYLMDHLDRKKHLTLNYEVIYKKK